MNPSYFNKVARVFLFTERMVAVIDRKTMIEVISLFEARLVQHEPLVHGVHSLLVEILANNFSRYHRVYGNLVAEIEALKKREPIPSELLVAKQGYFNSLLHAKAVIDFWYACSLAYYGVNNGQTNISRILPKHREIIKVSENGGSRSEQKNNHTRNNKKRGIKIRNKNN